MQDLNFNNNKTMKDAMIVFTTDMMQFLIYPFGTLQ